MDNIELLSQITSLIEGQTKQIKALQGQLQEHTIQIDKRFEEFSQQMEERFKEHTRQIDERMDKRFDEFSRQIDERMDKRFEEFGQQMDKRFEEHTRQIDEKMKGYVLDIASMMEEHTHEIKLYVENNVTRKINALYDGILVARSGQQILEGDIKRHDSQIDDLQNRVAVLEAKGAS